MRLIVFGASGGTGRAVVEQASAVGHEVTAFVRSPDFTAVPAVNIVRGSVLDRSAVTAAVRGHDAVFSALGTRPWRHEDISSQGTAVISAAMAAAGVHRIIVVSTQGIGNSSVGTMTKPIVALILRKAFHDKAMMEEALAATDLEWTIVRPGLLTNGKPRGEWRTDDQGVLRGGKIARADVAAFVVKELTEKQWVRKRPTLVW
jgi:putative NADH-flavin reductase